MVRLLTRWKGFSPVRYKQVACQYGSGLRMCVNMCVKSKLLGTQRYLTQRIRTEAGSRGQKWPLLCAKNEERPHFWGLSGELRCRRRDSNPHPLSGERILSPPRLPVPPLRLGQRPRREYRSASRPLSTTTIGEPPRSSAYLGRRLASVTCQRSSRKTAKPPAVAGGPVLPQSNLWSVPS